MDVGWFLHERLKFIDQFYKTAAAPYVLRKDQIELGVTPFEPPYSEDGEPPFQNEWFEADDSLHVLGYSCISMLSDTLKIFFATWSRLLNLVVDDRTAKVMKRQGFVSGYRVLFEKHLEIRLQDSGVDFDLLQQMVLVRNRVQHHDSLTLVRPNHSKHNLALQKSPFFLNEDECKILSDSTANRNDVWLIAPRIAVSAEHLADALAAVANLSDWMDEVAGTIRYRRNRQPSKLPEGT